jgi:2-polyprenyl-3-methyl-5-hydroxy-6-metoxy-1,4-benzoquinol methylase
MNTEVRQPNFYNAVYRKKSWRYFKRYDALYKAALGYIKPTDNVLELGCGMGSFAGEYYANRCKDFRALDFSNVGISMARKRWGNLSNKFTLIDFLSAPLPKFDYTIVCSLEVLEHIDKDIELLTMLKPGVTALLSVPKNEKLVNGKPKGYPVHRRSYSEDTIKDRYGEVLNIKEIRPIVSWFLIVGETI